LHVYGAYGNNSCDSAAPAGSLEEIEVCRKFWLP
jgi:hypothetical protein